MAYGSDEEVGYDPTVIRVPPTPDDGQVKYKFWIRTRFDEAEHEESSSSNPGALTAAPSSEQGRWYVTKEYLSSYKADRITGNGTRVWLVYDENDPKKTELVLKDVWTCSERKSEKETLNCILQDMGKNADAPPNFQDYFMTILADEAVMVNGEVDKVSEKTLESCTLDPYWDYYHSMVSTFSKRRYEARTHRRVLFKEYGRPLNHLTNQREYLQAVNQAIIGKHSDVC